MGDVSGPLLRPRNKLQAVRAQARLGTSQDRRHQAEGACTIDVDGQLGPDPHNLLRSLMSKLEDKTSLGVQEVQEDASLKAGQWQFVLDHGTNRPTGQIRFVVEGSIQAAKVKDAINQKMVVVGGVPLPIRLSNLVTMPLPRTQKNGIGEL